MSLDATKIFEVLVQNEPDEPTKLNVTVNIVMSENPAFSDQHRQSAHQFVEFATRLASHIYQGSIKSFHASMAPDGKFVVDVTPTKESGLTPKEVFYFEDGEHYMVRHPKGPVIIPFWTERGGKDAAVLMRELLAEVAELRAYKARHESKAAKEEEAP